MAGDGKIVIDVILEDGSVAKGVADLDGKIKGLGGSGEKASLGIGKIVAALGLVALASKGIDMIKQSLDGAISRYDTLNQFPRVLEMMGFDAKESQGAIDRLSDGIQGLPTPLDAVAKTAQNIAVMTGDLDGAVDTTLALNNAFLASGSSTADASRGLEQYVQMLSKGEVDLQSWRTLQETMGPALNQVAEAFGFAGDSAQNDLYAALKDGTVTFDQFNGKMIEMSEKTGGFADMAYEGSKGIATSWANIKTAMVSGVEKIIRAIDESLGGVGAIADVMDIVKDKMATAFTKIAEAIPPIIEAIKSVYDILEPWLPLIVAIVAGIIGFSATISIISGVKAMIVSLQAIWVVLNATIMANPIALVVAAIIAAAILVFVYWEPIKEFFIMLWGAIKIAGLAIWEALKEKWAEAVETLKSAWSSVTDFFSSLWESISSAASNAWNAITTAIMAVVTPLVDGVMNIFNSMKDGIQMIMDGLSAFFKAVWDIIKNIFVGALLLIINLVTGNFEELKSNSEAIMNNIKDAIKRIWEAIKNIFQGVVKAIVALIKSSWEGIKTATSTAFNAVKNLITTIWEGIKTFFTTTLSNLVTTARNKFNEVKNAIKEKLTEAVTIVSQKVGEMPGKVIEKAGEMLSAGKDLIKGLINGIKQMGKNAIEAVTGVVDGVVNKAKSILGIASPSKVFTLMGKQTVEGYEVGVKIRRKHAELAIKNLFDGILKETKVAHAKESKTIRNNNAEMQKIEKRAGEDIHLIKQKALKAKRELTEAENIRIRRIEEDSAKKILALKEKNLKEEEKLNAQQLKDMKKHNEEMLKTVEKYVSDKRSNGEMSLSDEIYFWNALYGTAEKGSEQYELGMKNHQDAVKKLRAEMESVNKEYSDKMIAIEKEYNDESKKLHDEWVKAYDDRMNQLLNFAGVFDEFKKKTEVSGQDLITNLESQVVALDEYGKVINSLSNRLDDDNLIKELKSLGVKSLGELQALNSLSDSELEAYANLYGEKFRLAKEQTDTEMKPMMDDIDEKLVQLKKDTEKRLDELDKEWQAKIKQIVNGTRKEFDSMKQVGIDAMTGLSDGIGSMRGKLMSQAQSIAQSIKNTIASAFNINSPSRWMRDMIGKNMMLGWMQGIDGEKSATLRKAGQMTDWMKPELEGFTNNLRGVSVSLGSMKPINSVGGGGSSVTNTNSRSFSPTIQNYFSRDISTPSDVARKNKQQQQQLAMEWGLV